MLGGDSRSEQHSAIVPGLEHERSVGYAYAAYTAAPAKPANERVAELLERDPGHRVDCRNGGQLGGSALAMARLRIAYAVASA